MADSILAPFDSQVANSVILRVGGKRIQFQFPPRITSDGKSSNWKSIFQASWEPLKIYWGSEARKLSFEAEWIATGSGVFTPQGIAEQMRTVKEYFYSAQVGRGPYPLVKLKAYEIVPSEAPFRLMDFSDSLGETLVRSGGAIFPLYSKMTLSLELATNISGKPAEGVDVKKPKITVKGLQAIQPLWK